MNKKISSFLLIFSMLFSLQTTVLAKTDQANTFLFRNGFILEAQDHDETGISPTTAFTLATQHDIGLDIISQGFSIVGEPKPDIQFLAEKQFKIVLQRPLLENRVYIFRLEIPKHTSTEWQFQTRAPFEITGSLPGNQMNNVPINSGIEIYFSHTGFENVESHFSISPKVEGRFEIHDKTLVFVPKALQEQTLYTVKIEKGIKISGTDRAIDTEYQFSFETEKGMSSQQIEEWKGNISFGQGIVDVTSKEAPEIPITYYINSAVYKQSSYPIKTNVYAYPSFEKFSFDYMQKNNTPTWANYTYTNFFTSTSTLTKILEFTQEFTTQQNDINTIKLPTTLPRGYYLVDSYWNDIRFQTFIQVTNTGIYLSESSSNTIVWLHDKVEKTPIAGAKVSSSISSNTNVSDQQGVVYFPTPKEDIHTAYTKYLVVRTADGQASLLDYPSNVYHDQNNYWQHVQTDKALYQPNDEVKVWGFVKHRYSSEDLKYLTLEVTGGNQYRNKFYISNPLPMIKQTVDVRQGFFSSECKLPYLEEGGYGLSIKNGDQVIASTYFTVQKYTKPAYKIQISKDKQAVFPNQDVNLTIKSSFFEGTALSDLPIDIFMNDLNNDGQGTKFSGVSNQKGEMVTKYIPRINSSSLQGELSVPITARATLPESADISEDQSIRVFVNNIDIKLDSKMKDGVAIIAADVKNIVLDRLNNGTARDSGDFLGTPVTNHLLSGKLYKNVWKEIEDGQYYDFINKTTQKTYRYELQKTPIQEFSLHTDQNGKAMFTYPVEKTTGVYYTVNLECKDKNERPMQFESYVWEYSPIYDQYIETPEVIDNTFKLSGQKENYTLGETIDLTCKKGTSTMPDGRYLYIIAQNGIREYVVSNQPNFTKEFTNNDIPNITIQAVYFDDKSNYHTAALDVQYHYQERNLQIQAKLDKSSYKPGEIATIIVDVTDKKGNPVAATIHGRIVDEALLKLSNQSIDLLPNLFAVVTSGIRCNKTSHTIDRPWIGQIMRPLSFAGDVRANSRSLKTLTKSESIENKTIRQEFKDTAYYDSIETDETGHGQLSFKLPDNVTSWRVSLDGISQDLHAGSNTVSLNVSLPFVINYSFNTTYLVGDTPVIGINAYGDSLSENDLVQFEVSSINHPEQKVSATGKAFERINLPLWNLSEGNDKLIIHAFTNKGLEDTLQHSFQVLSSYYQIQKHKGMKVTPQVSFSAGSSGNTSIVFTDKGKGQFLSQLLELANPWGNRLDQLVGSNEAKDLIQQNFEDEIFQIDSSKIDIQPYQREDGGMSLKTYGESDLILSACLARHIKDFVNVVKLRDYFYQQLESKTRKTAIPALLGLASLQEPVLNELETYSKLDNLSTEEAIYLALAYCEFNDLNSALDMYHSNIEKRMVSYKPYSFIESNTGKNKSIELTGLSSILATKLGLQESESLFAYIKDNVSSNVYTGLFKLQYIQNSIKNYSSSKASFTYTLNGVEKTIDLSKEGTHTIIIPSKVLSNFKVEDVKGDVYAVLIYKEAIDAMGDVDSSLSVERKYYHLDGKPITDNILKQGDIVKVQLSWKIDSKGMEGEYEITDFLPSGLKTTEGVFNQGYYTIVDGQTVKFSIYNAKETQQNNILEYHARVITPGTYLAQGAIIQNVNAPTSIGVAPKQTFTIDSTSDIIATPLDPNAIKIRVNQQPVIFDVLPYIDSGRTMVPMRSIFEVLGAKVKWNESERSVTGIKNNNMIVIKIDSKEATVNGETKSLDVPATIIGNRAFVPVRFISEYFGSKVAWDEKDRTVIIE